MTWYITRRLGQAVVVVTGVVVLTFLITRVIPSDPAAIWVGPHAGAAQIAHARITLGLNKPLWYQLITYLEGIFRGNWGVSLRTHRPVLLSLLQVIPASLELVVPALVIALTVGVPLGLVAVRFHGHVIDHAARTVSIMCVSLPAFWLAAILQLVFFQVLHVLPVASEYTPALAITHPLTAMTGVPVIDALLTANWPVLGSSLQHLVLPSLAVAAYPTGVMARMVRATVLEHSEESHSQMIRALGFPERSVLARFSLRLAWNPILQVLALVFVFALVNTFLVESVFDWPGLGSYAAAAITNLDTPAIVGITLFIAIVYVFGNVAVDLLQALFDPRIRLR